MIDDMSARDQWRSPRIAAAEWFAGGQRLWYDPTKMRIASEGAPDAIRVFVRVAADHGRQADADTVWLTMLPGFPDGSYGWAEVDRLLGAKLGPRLYVEPVGQGDSDKPLGYQYTSFERADLVEALWRHFNVRHTVVITFDYTSLALLELLRRKLERASSIDGLPDIGAAFIVNGGLFADAHTHPWQGTPLLRTPLGALGMRQAQRSPAIFARALTQARMHSPSYTTDPEELAQMWAAVARHNGARFMHDAAGFVVEHRRNKDRWNFAEIAEELGSAVSFYVGGSAEDPYEHRQITATRSRVPQAKILAFPGGHLTTSEHPDLLAAAILNLASSHGVSVH